MTQDESGWSNPPATLKNYQYHGTGYNGRLDARCKRYSKLEQKKENYQKLYVMLQEEVKKHKENSEKYKLFIGFKKLGEFSSILEAKQYADQTDQTGRFSLLGNKYHDTWYVSQWDIKKEDTGT